MFYVFPDWKRHGVKYIKDIIKDNERLFTVEEIKQKIVGCRGSIVLDFNAVINAIPKTWLGRIFNRQITDLEIERLTARKHQYLRSKTHKRLKERFLIRRNRTKRAFHFIAVLYFKSTYSSTFFKNCMNPIGGREKNFQYNLLFFF